MLHHLGIEVAPADISAAVGFFELLGFAQVEPPATLREFTWLERGGTQVHLMPEDEPTVPSPGHLAVVVDDFEATVAGVWEVCEARVGGGGGAGLETERKREHWGEPRALAIAPGGHRVELMAAP